MSYNPNNPDGAATGANSAPVVTATDDANLTPLKTSGGGAYVRQDSNATIAKESGGNLATIATDVAPLVASSAGGYIRQDSNASIAKESGGNLATIAGAISSSVLQGNIKQINGGTAANSQLAGSLAVGGGVANNTALTSGTYPLLIAGSDYGGTPKIQNLKVDSTGLGYTIDAADGSVSAGTAASKSMLAGLVYNSSAPAPTNGQQVALQGDTAANLMVTLATLISGEDQTVNVLKVEQRFSYTNMTSATTTTIKSGAGFLHAITINKGVASATISLFDNTAGSGTSIGVITLPSTVGNPFTLILDASFATGLTVTTSGATDVTFSWR